MIEDADNRLGESADGDALLYDWFKHLTSLSLLTLGGILTLSQVIDGEMIKKPLLAGVLVVVATAGILSFSGAAQIVKGRSLGMHVPPRVYKLQTWAAMVLSMGVGAFLYLFVRSMG
jgi:hypothetical protein